MPAIETLLDELRAYVGSDPAKARHVDAIANALATVYRRGEFDTRAVRIWDKIVRVAAQDAELRERMVAVSAILQHYAHDLGWRNPARMN